MGLADLASLSGSAAAHAVLSWCGRQSCSGWSSGRSFGRRDGSSVPKCTVAAVGRTSSVGYCLGWRRFQTVREMLDARAFPMPGQLIDIGGHRLHRHCTGSGSHTVVLKPGHGATSSDLGWIAPAVAPDTKVCVYDRAGRGWSDAADGPQDAAQIAADLHTLLARADVGPHRWPHTLGSRRMHWRALVWLLPFQASPARRDGQFPANRRPLWLVPTSRCRDGRRPD
jgi:hypothetical protein